jgi:hypothetical protein
MADPAGIFTSPTGAENRLRRFNMALPRDRLAKASEVANYLNTSVAALHTQRYRSEEPGSLGVVIGRKLLFKSEDIESWVEQRLALAREAV